MIRRIFVKFGKNKLTKCKEGYKSFYLKKTTWQAMITSRGWKKRGAISRMAEELGITRQYASMLVSGKAGCSADVMHKIKHFFGINGSCWCHLFEEYRLDEVDKNHPIFNQQKCSGEVPYDHFSDSAELRNKDYKTEHQKNP